MSPFIPENLSTQFGKPWFDKFAKQFEGFSLKTNYKTENRKEEFTVTQQNHSNAYGAQWVLGKAKSSWNLMLKQSLNPFNSCVDKRVRVRVVLMLVTHKQAGYLRRTTTEEKRKGRKHGMRAQGTLTKRRRGAFHLEGAKIKTYKDPKPDTK